MSEYEIFEHPGGRLCRFMPDDDEWRYDGADDGTWRFPCDSPRHSGPRRWDISDCHGPAIVSDCAKFIMTVTEEGVSVSYGLTGYSVDAETEEARIILKEVLPALLGTFLEKNSKYKLAQSGHDLGVRGIVPDLNRKTSVVIDRLWNGTESGSQEPTEEVIDDLIGHLLLMRAKMHNA